MVVDEYEQEERAAIRQFDGGYERQDAEYLADRDMRARDDQVRRLEAQRSASCYLDELEAERQ